MTSRSFTRHISSDTHKITTRWVTVKNKQNTSIRGCDHWALKTNQSTEYLQLAPPLPLCHCATHTLHLWVPLFLSQCLVSVINTQLIILETNLGILVWNICTCTSIYSTRMKYFQLAANWNQYHLRRADTDTHTHTYIHSAETGAAGLQLSLFRATKNGWVLVTRSGNSLYWQKNSWLLVVAVFNLAPRRHPHWPQIGPERQTSPSISAGNKLFLGNWLLNK